MDEHNESLSHPSRPIPNEAYPDDQNQGRRGVGSPTQDPRPNQIPVSLHSFIRGHSASAPTPSAIGLSSFERDLAQYRNNRRVLSQWRQPPPSYYAATRSNSMPDIEMMPLRTALSRDEQVELPPRRQQQNGPQRLPNQASPRNDNPAPGEVVDTVSKGKRRKRDWIALVAVGAATILLLSVVTILAVVDPAA